MRIVIDLSKIEKEWFDVSEFEQCVFSIADEVKKYNARKSKKIDLYFVLENVDEIEILINSLTKSFDRKTIKTFFFDLPYDEKSKCDKTIKEYILKWYYSQFKADVIIVADYNFLLHRQLTKLVKTSIKSTISVKKLINELKPLIRTKSNSYYAKLAYIIENNKLFQKNNIYVDVSGNIVHDSISGIPRVVNGFVSGMQNILRKNDDSVSCYPIYSSINQNNYYYAESINSKFCKQIYEDGENVVQFHDVDILFMPDLIMGYTHEKENYLLSLKSRGVSIITYLHDIFPIYYPEQYSEVNISALYTEFLETISKFSGVISNSKTTLSNYLCWCKDFSIRLPNDFITDFAYLGADLKKANGSKGLPNDCEVVLGKLKKRTTLLMVGTICPRKNHELVLDAMDLLWELRKDINLVFVGNYGWKMESLVSRIESHNLLNDNLFWIKNASDEYLDLIYKNSDGVIYVSIDEGYGLPIVEASFYDKPLLLRDIEIFHEIAGDNATYYKGSKDPFMLADTINDWVIKIKNNTAIKSNKIKYFTWNESSKKILKILFKNKGNVKNDIR